MNKNQSYLREMPLKFSILIMTLTYFKFARFNRYCNINGTSFVLSYFSYIKQEAQLMLTTGSTRLAVSRGQQTWYHSTCYI